MSDLQKLYDVISDAGYYTKSFSEFEAQYQSPEYRDRVFDVVSGNRLYTKSREEFEIQYAPSKKKDATVSDFEVTGSEPTPSEERQQRDYQLRVRQKQSERKGLEIEAEQEFETRQQEKAQRDEASEDFQIEQIVSDSERKVDDAQTLVQNLSAQLDNARLQHEATKILQLEEVARESGINLEDPYLLEVKDTRPDMYADRIIEVAARQSGNLRFQLQGILESQASPQIGLLEDELDEALRQLRIERRQPNYATNLQLREIDKTMKADPERFRNHLEYLMKNQLYLRDIIGDQTVNHLTNQEKEVMPILMRMNEAELDGDKEAYKREYAKLSEFRKNRISNGNVLK